MDRKEWIEHRLKELAEIFGISVAGFAVLDNHLHLLVRLDPETAKNWSDEEVIRRWARLFPPRDKMRRPLEVSDDWVKGHLLNAAWIKRARQRLRSLSWFMKCLKEPLARLANQQDQTSGAFFEGRFKSPLPSSMKDPAGDLCLYRPEPRGGGDRATSRGERAHLDQGARRSRGGAGADRGPDGGPRRAVRRRRSRRPGWRRRSGSVPSRTGGGSIRPGRE